MQGGSVLYVCIKFEADGFIHSKVIRGQVQKFRNWVTCLKPRPLRGRFMVHTYEGSVPHLCTIVEADCSILSKVIKGVPKFGN